MNEVRLPELGENIEKVEVAAVLVALGDRVQRDQPLIEVETEKANLEVPAPSEGTVAELLVAVGDTLAVGQVFLKLSATDAVAVPAATPAKVEAAVARSHVEAALSAVPSGNAASAAAEPRPEPAQTAPVAAEPSVIEFPVASRKPVVGPSVPAAPSVRRLARELGVNVLEVPGSGPGGRISRDDVKAFAKRLIAAAATGGATAPAELPDFSRWGEVVAEPLSNVRRATARNLATAWATVPHVTQFDRADITQLESMRRRFNERDESEGRKLTMTAIVIKMVASALRQYPEFNASLDLLRDAVIYKKYVHVGVAVDTERGLLVPVVRDADRKTLVQISAEVAELATKARARKLTPDEMAGASFTVSNLGGLGTTYFTPIVPWPQVAILGVGRAEQQAVFHDGQFQPRLIMPLSVSYDHRLIDGADAARFLRWIAEALEQPLLLLLEE